MSGTSSAAPARRIGNYEVIRKLGRGMADVYLAADIREDRRVVLKVIEHAHDYTTQLALEAEKRGAQIQKQLHDIDPRILEVYETGEQDGCFYAAMEYFEGESVAEILERERRLDAARAASYVIEVLDQLQILHSFVTDLEGRRRAVVHGDVKPSNIQIGRVSFGGGEQVRLLDFGIAKMITETHNLTRQNLGSPIYCSPERLGSAQVDVQSDLWATAVTLYEMVSGMAPYQAATTRKLEALIQSRRPPRALPETCPPRLRAILFKALSADIGRRYATAVEFAGELRAFLENRVTVAEGEKLPAWEANETIRKTPPVLPAAPPRPIRPPRGRPWIGIAAAVIALGISTGAVAYWAHEQTRPLREVSAKSLNSAAAIEAHWNVYQKVSGNRLLSAPEAQANFRKSLLGAAASVIDGYRNSSDPILSDFDWTRAKAALGHALQIDPADTEARGQLALCDGYLNLIENPKGAAAQKSEAKFLLAAADAPKSPDAHLALARLYVYGFRNIGLALGQFHEAERRGFHGGPREQEQQGDGYLYRAEYELGRARRASGADALRWLKQSAADLDRARDLYEPLYGFSRVSASLEQVQADRAGIAAATPKPPPPPVRAAKRGAGAASKRRVTYGRH